MVFVYVLGKVETGRELDVLDALKNFDQVKRISLTYGIYDFCLEAKFATMEKLDDFLFTVLRKTSGVKDTFTLVTSRTISKEGQMETGGN